MITSPVLENLETIRHGFFTRRGGVSAGLLTSLNCGFGAGEAVENVVENRNRAMAKIGCAAGRLNTVYQIHSSDVVVADCVWDREQRPKADAIVTTETNLAIGILTADCTPVLFADPENRVIGAAHAGWRGALAGVLENCVSVMEKKGADRTNISAVVGPCIHQKSYEVGPEFLHAFVDESAANRQFFLASNRHDHFLFDLPRFIKSRLGQMNLRQVDDVDIDTYADPDRFYSFRRGTHRNESEYGRGLSAIVLKG